MSDKATARECKNTSTLELGDENSAIDVVNVVRLAQTRDEMEFRDMDDRLYHSTASHHITPHTLHHAPLYPPVEAVAVASVAIPIAVIAAPNSTFFDDWMASSSPTNRSRAT